MAIEVREQKESWQMTDAEYIQRWGGNNPRPQVVQGLRGNHHNDVKRAILDDKPVPLEVLREFTPSGLKLTVDNPQSYVNIKPEGRENDTTRSNLATADTSAVRSASPSLSQDVPAERIPSNEEGRRTPGEHSSPGESGNVLRNEPDSERDVRPGSMESGNPPEHTGLGERLTPAPVSHDINLNTSNAHRPFSATERWNANMDALRALKIIENDNRKATPEEQAIIARYSGFGDSAFGKAFDPPYHSSYDKNPVLDPFEKRGAETSVSSVTETSFQAVQSQHPCWQAILHADERWRRCLTPSTR